MIDSASYEDLFFAYLQCMRHRLYRGRHYQRDVDEKPYSWRKGRVLDFKALLAYQIACKRPHRMVEDD